MNYMVLVWSLAPLGALSNSFAKSRSISLPFGDPLVMEAAMMMLFLDTSQ